MRMSRWGWAFLASLPFAAWLSGCVEINRPKAMIYSTSSYYYGEGRDHANNDYGMSVEFRRLPFGGRSEELPVQYGEPSDFSLTTDSSKRILELRIKTNPDLRAVEDFFGQADVKLEVSAYYPSIDSLAGIPPNSRWRDSVVVQCFLKGSGGAWERRDSLLLGWVWERHGDKLRKHLDLSIPEGLLGSTPVLGWVLVRYLWEGPVRLPYQPTLFIRDEQGFKDLTYP